MNGKVEVLAPAGSLESLIAAVNSGADAVYIGGTKFGARAYANNPEEDILLKGLEYAHHFGVKVYMTVNTLLKEKEIQELYLYLLPYYKAGLDAIIVQDLGVLDFIQKYFPDIEIHASTQMSLMGYESIKKLYQMGVTRVVPARELSLVEIQQIRKSCGIEIECFVHGALCYAYSGQCLMSSLIGGRSANRGRCAQTCRLSYEVYESNTKEKPGKRLEKSSPILSCKDLCSLDILPDMIEVGVNSLKIEGRMKSPRYTAGVVRIWRKYVDLYLQKGRKGYKVNIKDREELLDLFHRGGQTEGYYFQHNGREMLALNGKPEIKQLNEELFRYLDNNYINIVKKHRIYGEIRIQLGKPLELSLELQDRRGYRITVQGGIVEPAQNRSAKIEDIQKQIQKLGNTLYEFTKLDIILDSEVFVPVKALNDLRRDAIQSMDRAILEKYNRVVNISSEIPIKTSIKVPVEAPNRIQDVIVEERALERNLSIKDKKEWKKTPIFHCVCETAEQLQGIKKLSENVINGVFMLSFAADTLLPKQWKSEIAYFHQRGIKVGLYLPHIFRREAREFFDRNIEYLYQAGFDSFMIRSLEEVEYIKDRYQKSGNPIPELVFDYNIYNYNRKAMKMLEQMGANRQTLPVELNLYELKELDCKGKEMVVYGRLPMMVSAQCIKKTTKGCDHKPELLYLKDRYKENMPVKNHCLFCYNTIYNAKPLSTLGIAKSIQRLEVYPMRLIFTIENENEVQELVKKYQQVYQFGKKITEEMGEFTRGHLKRGIE